jgi:hypothetical protein
MPTQGPHPTLGDISHIGETPDTWPDTWKERSGFTAERRVPRGRDHTIAEALAAAAQGPVTARIQATVKTMAVRGDGSSAIVYDDTGTMRIWCPAAVRGAGPGQGGTYEFTIELPHPSKTRESAPPEPADLTPEEAAVYRRLMDVMAPADATAIDVRHVAAW